MIWSEAELSTTSPPSAGVTPCEINKPLLLGERWLPPPPGGHKFLLGQAIP